ncbi:StbB family protein [Dickeya sp. NCPPB 3274]|uniref:StbB family protein n=1 Tax=Dickeya sp. NCPPB 3274 TaxID=568766 RepID=UPI0005B4034A|nr:StbB family protein [Dickeya sp. NCPPB 3274]
MKVVILNYCGTVGKTTLAAHVFAPRMMAPVYAIESINETAQGLGIDVEKMTSDKFRGLLRKIMIDDDAIIDVGASNIEMFMSNMVKFSDSHEEFDLFVIPVTPGTKEQKESIIMLGTLSSMGIPPEKIKVVFNRVNSDVSEEFAYILGMHKKDKSFTLNTQCAVFENEIFDALTVKGLTVDAILSDSTDYKALLKNKDAPKKDREYWADMYGLKSLAKGVKKNLDVVFENLGVSHG